MKPCARRMAQSVSAMMGSSSTTRTDCFAFFDSNAMTVLDRKPGAGTFPEPSQTCVCNCASVLHDFRVCRDFGDQGQEDQEASAMCGRIGPAFDGDSTAMFLDELFDYPKAQPSSNTSLRGEKRLEQLA